MDRAVALIRGPSQSHSSFFARFNVNIILFDACATLHSGPAGILWYGTVRYDTYDTVRYETCGYRCRRRGRRMLPCSRSAFTAVLTVPHQIIIPSKLHFLSFRLLCDLLGRCTTIIFACVPTSYRNTAVQCTPSLESIFQVGHRLLHRELYLPNTQHPISISTLIPEQKAGQSIAQSPYPSSIPSSIFAFSHFSSVLL